MIGPETIAILQEIIRREGCSILFYVGDAFPWASARDGETLKKMHELIAAEKKAHGAVVDFLQRQRVYAAAHGTYPASFTTINFLALSHVLPRLAAYERDSIPETEKQLARIPAGPARTLVESLLQTKRDNLKALESLISARSQPAA